MTPRAARARRGAIVLGLVLVTTSVLAGSALAQEEGGAVDEPTGVSTEPPGDTQTDEGLGDVPTDEGLGDVPTDEGLGDVPTDEGLGDVPTDEGFGGAEEGFGGAAEGEGEGAATAIFLGSLVVILCVSALIVWQKTREGQREQQTTG